MKLTIEQPHLLAALTQAGAIVERKNTIPILANVLLTATVDGKLTIRATDLDIEVTTAAQAEVTDDGSATVSAGMLTDIIKRLAKGKVVQIDHADSTLHITSGKSEYSLATLPVGDFPQLASDTYANTATMHATEFAALFARTAFAVSTEETRYYLNGVYVHNDATTGALTAAATDGHRLAMMVSPVAATVSSVIVPRKAVGEFKKLTDGDVTVETSDTKIRVTNGDLVMVSKVIDGTFPDYRRVIPADNNRIVNVDAKALNDAIARVVPVSEDRARGVKLGVSSDGTMELSVTSHVGTATDEIETDYHGDAFSIGFNSKYLSEIIAQAESGGLEMAFGPSGSAAVIIRPEAIDGLMTVQMRMRI